MMQRVLQTYEEPACLALSHGGLGERWQKRFSDLCLRTENSPYGQDNLD